MIDKDEEGLLKRSNNSKTFYKQMAEAETNYHLLIQQGQYCDLSMFPQKIIERFPLKDTLQKQISNQSQLATEIYFYYGVLQPDHSLTLEKLAMNLIKNFPKPKKGYILVYVNNFQKSNSSAALADFKKMFLMLPIQYFTKLRKVIVMKSTFFQKATQYLSFGVLTKYLKDKTYYISTLDKIAQDLGIQYTALVRFLPQKVARQLSIPDYEKVAGKSKQGHLGYLSGKIINIGKPRSIMYLKPKKAEGWQLYQHEVTEVGVPIILHMLIFFFKDSPQGLNQQGIFRKSVSIEEENQILQQLSRKNYDCLQQVVDPHIVANLIKRFISGLKTPLIPYEAFWQLMKDQTIQNIRNVLSKLKRLNYITLLYLLEFLNNEVIPRENINQMGVNNLAICFAPCLMRSETPSFQDLVYAGKSVNVVKNILNNFEQIFGNRKRQQQIYRSSYSVERKKSLQLSKFNIAEQVNYRASNGNTNIQFRQVQPDPTRMPPKEYNESFDVLEELSEDDCENEQKDSNNRQQQQNAEQIKSNDPQIFKATIRFRSNENSVYQDLTDQFPKNEGNIQIQIPNNTTKSALYVKREQDNPRYSIQVDRSSHSSTIGQQQDTGSNQLQMDRRSLNPKYSVEVSKAPSQNVIDVSGELCIESGIQVLSLGEKPNQEKNTYPKLDQQELGSQRIRANGTLTSKSLIMLRSNSSSNSQGKDQDLQKQLKQCQQKSQATALGHDMYKHIFQETQNHKVGQSNKNLKENK